MEPPVDGDCCPCVERGGEGEVGEADQGEGELGHRETFFVSCEADGDSDNFQGVGEAFEELNGDEGEVIHDNYGCEHFQCVKETLVLRAVPTLNKRVV